MNRILFFQTFFATDGSGNSRPQFEAGKHYPADDAEAVRCIARGIAEAVDVPEVEAEEAAAEVDAQAEAEGVAEAVPAAKKAKK